MIIVATCGGVVRSGFRLVHREYLYDDWERPGFGQATGLKSDPRAVPAVYRGALTFVLQSPRRLS